MHIYTLSKVYGVCSLCGNKADHPAHYRSDDIRKHGPLTVESGKMFHPDGRAVVAGDLIDGEQYEFRFVSSKKEG